ncbi:MAG: TIGR04282 family arsenosugar biosynthesis glycosyltransferase [Dehalococcoidia bacterium]|nr:TIGR04282 family arsenosugar biosynthesis glycosyltransferase [Dehalococcoidia bacterium]
MSEWGSGVGGQGSGDAGRALIITAKYPYPGAVKTRLASRLGFGLAAGLYRAFLRDLDAAFPGAFWAYAPAESPFPDLLGAGRRYLVQEGADLGERMANLFCRLFGQGFGRVVLVGSDIPHLSPALVEKAFEALARYDVVLGPAMDGGYYLLGMRASHDLFSGIEWSTPRVLTQTLAKVAEQGISFSLLPQSFDIDEPEDLDKLMALVDAELYGLLTHTSAILSRVRHADATLGQSKLGWYYNLTTTQVDKEEKQCLRIVRLDDLSRPLRHHMTIVAGVASVLVARLREDLGIPLSNVAVIAAKYHDAYRSGDNGQRLRPYGVGTREPFFPHDGHEVRLAFALRQVEARTVARIVRRHNVLRPLFPETRTIDDNVLLIADSMVEGGEVVPVAVRREAVIARHAGTYPQGDRVYRAAYDVVERTLGLYIDAGLDRRLLTSALGLLPR